MAKVTTSIVEFSARIITGTGDIIFAKVATTNRHDHLEVFFYQEADDASAKDRFIRIVTNDGPLVYVGDNTFTHRCSAQKGANVYHLFEAA
jgi:hypothetical protein